MQAALGTAPNPWVIPEAPELPVENRIDVDAFIESLLAQDAVPPLSTELVPASLAKGLGICTDSFLGQQGSNGRQGSKPSQPTTGPGAGPSSTPGVNRSNEGRPADPRHTDAEKLQLLTARVRKLEQQHGGPSDVGLEEQQAPSKPARLPNQTPPAPASVLLMNQTQQQQISRSALYTAPASQAQQQMQAAFAQQYAQQLAQQQQQQQQQAYMQAAYQQQAQQAQQAAAAAFGQYSSWPPPNPYTQYGNPYYGMQYNMQYAQAMAASMAAAAASPADIVPPNNAPNAAGATAVAGPQTYITDGGASDGEEGDETRAIKRPRLIWTQPLHKRFLEAVEKCGGIDRALPKAIMKEMSVGGLTRENVASHLQKFRQRQKKGEDGGLNDDEGGLADDMFHGDEQAKKVDGEGQPLGQQPGTAIQNNNNRVAHEFSFDDKGTRRSNRRGKKTPIVAPEAAADVVNNAMGSAEAK